MRIVRNNASHYCAWSSGIRRGQRIAEFGRPIDFLRGKTCCNINACAGSDDWPRVVTKKIKRKEKKNTRAASVYN